MCFLDEGKRFRKKRKMSKKSAKEIIYRDFKRITIFCINIRPGWNWSRPGRPINNTNYFKFIKLKTPMSRRRNTFFFYFWTPNIPKRLNSLFIKTHFSVLLLFDSCRAWKMLWNVRPNLTIRTHISEHFCVRIVRFGLKLRKWDHF